MIVIDTLLRWFKENERQKMRHVRRHYLPMEEVRRRVDEADEVLLEYCAVTPPASASSAIRTRSGLCPA